MLYLQQFTEEDVKIYVPTIAFQSYIRHLGGYAANGVGAQGIDNRVHYGMIEEAHYRLTVLRLF